MNTQIAAAALAAVVLAGCSQDRDIAGPAASRDAALSASGVAGTDAPGRPPSSVPA